MSLPTKKIMIRIVLVTIGTYTVSSCSAGTKGKNSSQDLVSLQPQGDLVPPQQLHTTGENSRSPQDDPIMSPEPFPKQRRLADLTAQPPLPVLLGRLLPTARDDSQEPKTAMKVHDNLKVGKILISKLMKHRFAPQALQALDQKNMSQVLAQFTKQFNEKDLNNLTDQLVVKGINKQMLNDIAQFIAKIHAISTPALQELNHLEALQELNHLAQNLSQAAQRAAQIHNASDSEMPLFAQVVPPEDLVLAERAQEDLVPLQPQEEQ